MGVYSILNEITDALNQAFLECIEEQQPFVVQPIWKTVGKSSMLHEDCLDVFVWSNLAFTRLFFDMSAEAEGSRRMTRHQRCLL